MSVPAAPLRGRAALVTGSTSGIGLGIAEALARDGADVVITGLGDDKQIAMATRAVGDAGAGRVEYVPAELTDPDEIERLVADTIAGLGALHILVNNAGIQHVSPIESFPPAQWDRILAINLSAAFHTTRCAVPAMKTAGWGRIVNVASAHALVASPFKSAYVAAKHGLAGLTKTVALELAREHITVNAVAPGYVKTPLVENQIADTARARGLSEDEVVETVMLAAQPTRQFVQIEQVAAMVAYLCSDAAASVTGAVLSIDGGWSAA